MSDLRLLSQKMLLYFGCCLTIQLFASTGPLAGDSPDWRKQASEALNASLDLGHPDFMEMRDWLMAGEYDRIDSVFEDILGKFKTDVNYESVLEKAFRNMSRENAYRRSDFDRWVNETGSPLAFAARGIYLAQLGFSLRGGRYIAETSDKQLRDMYDSHVQAASDLFKAIEDRPDYLPAFHWLIQIAKASPVTFTERDILHRALQQDNRTYYVRYSYIRSQLPRWGGTYLEMENFARESAKYADINPRLWSLQGEVAADLADLQWQRGDLQAAVDLYTEALEYGDRITWLNSRGTCHYKLGQYDEAVADFVQVLHYSPNDRNALSMLDRMQQ